MPGLGSVPLTDGRGIIQREFEAARLRHRPGDAAASSHTSTSGFPLARDVVGWSLRRAEQRGEPLHLALGFDDLILSNSRLILAAQLWFHQFLPVDYLRSRYGRRYGRLISPSVGPRHRALRTRSS